MILPSNEECVRVLKELRNEPSLTEWEESFVESNLYRKTFSDAQREAIATLCDKFEV